MGTSPDPDFCWVTLVTKPSYLPGVIMLAHSLDKHHSKYRLLVLYSDSIGPQARGTLETEANRSNRIRLHHIHLLLPSKQQTNTGSVAERFADTFTKLRAFQVWELGYTKCVFLDADMAVFKNPDDLLDSELEGRDCIAANHACVCNLDSDSWAPSNWHKGNCAYTPLTSPQMIASRITAQSRPTYHLLNSGMFVYRPNEDLWRDLIRFFTNTDKLKDFKFPDQDFMTEYFRGRWQPVSWRYNAIKTMEYWHPNLWSDNEVAIVHYIVDKPWERRVREDGVAGHLGRDGKTHRWWWNLYIDWSTMVDKNTLNYMEDLVDTKEPQTVKVPLPQEPGQPDDVKSYDNSTRTVGTEGL